MATTDTAVESPVAEASGRDRIVREARALFLAQGYAAVSMQQIADAATINKATLYHHFRDKEALFLSVIASEIRRGGMDIRAAIDAQPTLRAQLFHVAEAVLAMQYSDFGRLLNDLHAHITPEGRKNLIEQCGVPWLPVRDAVELAIARGEVREIDPDLAARIFFAMVTSQRWARLAELPAPSDATLAATITSLFMDGLAEGGRGTRGEGESR